MLRESSIIVSRLTVARKNLILHLNTTQGAGVGAGLQNNILPTNIYVLRRAMVSVTNCSRLSYHTQSQIH